MVGPEAGEGGGGGDAGVGGGGGEEGKEHHGSEGEALRRKPEVSAVSHSHTCSQRDLGPVPASPLALMFSSVKWKG